jgi:hypothetical protein
MLRAGALRAAALSEQAERMLPERQATREWSYPVFASNSLCLIAE